MHYAFDNGLRFCTKDYAEMSMWNTRNNVAQKSIFSRRPAVSKVSCLSKKTFRKCKKYFLEHR